MLGASGDYQTDLWPLYVALALGGLLGILAGNCAGKHVNRKRFRNCTLLFLVLGGALMLSAGSRTLSTITAIGIAILWPIIGLFLLVRKLSTARAVTNEPATESQAATLKSGKSNPYDNEDTVDCEAPAAPAVVADTVTDIVNNPLPHAARCDTPAFLCQTVASAFADIFVADANPDTAVDSVASGVSDRVARIPSE